MIVDKLQVFTVCLYIVHVFVNTVEIVVAVDFGVVDYVRFYAVIIFDITFETVARGQNKCCHNTKNK